MKVSEEKSESSSILTLQSVAQYLRVHPSTIYRLLRKKQLPAFKVGHDWRFSLESIDRWRAEAERRGAINYYADSEKKSG